MDSFGPSTQFVLIQIPFIEVILIGFQFIHTIEDTIKPRIRFRLVYVPVRDPTQNLSHNICFLLITEHKNRLFLNLTRPPFGNWSGWAEEWADITDASTITFLAQYKLSNYARSRMERAITLHRTTSTLILIVLELRMTNQDLMRCHSTRRTAHGASSVEKGRTKYESPSTETHIHASHMQHKSVRQRTTRSAYGPMRRSRAGVVTPSTAHASAGWKAELVLCTVATTINKISAHCVTIMLCTA